MHNVWNTLAEAKLVEGEMPTSKEEHSPWYVQLLLAFSGWLAAIFLLGFLFAAFQRLFDSTAALFTLGTVMIVFAYIILKKEKNNFIEHLGLAISFAGQSLILFGTFSAINNSALLLWFSLFSFQTLLALLMPNYLHRLFSAFFAAYAFSVLLLHLGMPYSFSFIIMALFSYLSIHEFSTPAKIKKRQALAYGLVLALILIETSMIREANMALWRYHYPESFTLWFPSYLSAILEGLVTLIVALYILKQHHIYPKSKVGILAIISILFFTLLSFEMPGLLLGILIILLGFNHSNRILLGLGIFSLLFSASSYYYLLEITLIDKAIYLAVLGFVLLLGRWIVFHLLLPVRNSKEIQRSKDV